MAQYLHLLNIFILLSDINILKITYRNALKTVQHKINHYYTE